MFNNLSSPIIKQLSRSWSNNSKLCLNRSSKFSTSSIFKQYYNNSNLSLSKLSNSTKSFSKSLPLLFTSTASFLIINNLNSNKIYNDTAYANSPANIQIQQNSSFNKNKSPLNSTSNGGYLNYNELTIGSITGLFLGIIAGKLSSAILFLSLSSYFLIQFLESRNIISIPWNTMINIGSEKIKIKDILLHKPNFKISFILSFIIAAYNI